MASAELQQLFAAIDERDIERINHVLTNESVPDLVNTSCGPLEITPLHVASACGFGEDIATLMVDVLLQYGANATTRDILGRTALHHAASLGHYKLVSRLIDAGTPINAKIEIKSWKHNAEIRTCHRMTNSFFDPCLHFPEPDCLGRTALHQAVKFNHAQTVQLLLLNGADVNAPDEFGSTPLLLAGAGVVEATIDKSRAYEHIVAILIKGGAELNVQTADTRTTALHHAIVLQNEQVMKTLLEAGALQKTASCGETPLHEAAGRGWRLALEALLRYGGDRLVNQPDDVGRTPIHRAAYSGNRDCVAVLIRHGGNLAACTNTKYTVFDVIMLHIPRPVNFIMEMLDERITCNHFSVNDIHFKITLNFRILAPLGVNEQMAVIASILATGSDRQKMKIFQHPLIEAYLRMKWYRLCWFFYALLVIHVIFVVSLSSYVIQQIHCKIWTTISFRIARSMLMVSATWLCLHAFMQAAFVPRFYLRQYELYLNLICYTLSLLLAAFGAPPHYWMLHAASISVLLAWMQLMLLIGRLPTYGYYALMFSTVLKNVVKVLVTFVCLIIGFALSFSVQFHDSEHFQDPWKALVKTTVMMMGEFEYADMFQDASNDTTDPLLSGRLPGTSRIIFLIFIVLTSIVLMNLMVGLAVSDIQGLQTEGHTRRIVKQADFLTHMEKITSHRILKSKWCPGFIHAMLDSKRCLAASLTLHPGRSARIPNAAKWVKILPMPLLELIVEIGLKNYATVTGSQPPDAPPPDTPLLQATTLACIIKALQQLTDEVQQLKSTMQVEGPTNTAKPAQSPIDPSDSIIFANVRRYSKSVH